MKTIILLTVLLIACTSVMAEDLRIEGGVPISCSEVETVDAIAQETCLVYNSDGSVSVRLDCISYIEVQETSNSPYLLIKVNVDSTDYPMAWHRINRISEEALTCPTLLVISNGIARVGPGKLGFSLKRTATPWARITLGNHVTPEFLLDETQLANIKIELEKIVE